MPADPPAQVLGCIGGAILANVMFSEAAISISTKHRASGAHFLSEIVATAGLLVLIFALVRSDRRSAIPVAVGAYIAGAYFFTSSTSFANPAITVGRMFSNSFAGIAPSSVPLFVLLELVAVPIALVVIARSTQRKKLDSKRACMGDRPVVLFLCTHNAGRSLAAKVLLEHYANGRVEVRSAGSDPKEDLNPSVVTVLEERGLDPSQEVPRALTDAVRSSRMSS